MKKRLVYLLCLVMVLSLVGCSKSNDLKNAGPLSIYKDAFKKTDELNDMAGTITMKMQMTQGEETMDIDMNMDIKMTDTNSKEMKYLCNTKMSMLGMDLEMNMFYTDGYYYVETFGQKMKCVMDPSDMLDKISGSTMQTNNLSQYTKDIKATKEGDNTIITFQLNGEDMSEYMDEIMSGLGTGMEGSYSGSEGNVETKINKDGYFTEVKMSLVLDMDIEGETAKLNMDLVMVYDNPGKEIESIELPDLEGYTEVDPSEII